LLPEIENSKIIVDKIERYEKAFGYEHKFVIIFGCTLYANDIISALRKIGKEPDAFIDNDKQKEGSLCSGIRVYNPNYIKELSGYELLVIIASPTYAREMEGQMKVMGLKDDEIFIIPVVNPELNLEISDNIVKERISRVRRGIERYENIRAVYTTDIMFLFPYPGTGDIYLACGFLDTYIKKNKIEKYVLLLSKNNCKKVAELFGYSNIIVISNNDLKDILLAWQFIGTEKIQIKPALFWGWETKHYYRDYRKHKEMSFADYFKYDVFGLNDNDRFNHPKRKMINNDVGEKLFQEKKLKKGKTVIIAPYAGSFISAITMDEWKNVVKILKRKGYVVCTNCYGSELPIPGTSAIQFSYEEALDVLDYAGGFISVRSGLCDVVSNSKCNFLVIYESSYLASDYEYFSIKKMGLNNNVNEIEYETGDKLYKDVSTFF